MLQVHVARAEHRVQVGAVPSEDVEVQIRLERGHLVVCHTKHVYQSADSSEVRRANV